MCCRYKQLLLKQRDIMIQLTARFYLCSSPKISRTVSIQFFVLLASTSVIRRFVISRRNCMHTMHTNVSWSTHDTSYFAHSLSINSNPEIGGCTRYENCIPDISPKSKCLSNCLILSGALSLINFSLINFRKILKILLRKVHPRSHCAILRTSSYFCALLTSSSLVIGRF